MNGKTSTQTGSRAGSTYLLQLSQASGESPAITLRQAFADYQATRRLKKSTIEFYDYTLRHYLDDWLDKPIDSFTNERVLAKHKQLSCRPVKKGRGTSSANNAMRILRAVIEFSSFYYSDVQIAHNPVRALSVLKSWHREEKRRRHIKPSQLNNWMDAVLRMRNHTMRDLLQLIILTGLRKKKP